MKKLFLLFVLLVVSVSFAAGGAAPTRVGVDGGYEVHIDSQYVYGGLDTLDGADSIQILDAFNPTKGNRYGWEYILATSALSGDSAANAVVQVYVTSKDKNDSLIQHTLVDTIPAAGSFILFPFEHTMVAHTYDVWLKSLNANDEVLFKGVSIYRRRVCNVTRNWDGN